MDKEQIKKEIDTWYNWFNRGSYQWSFAYHFCLYGTTIITILIGFLSQLDDNNFLFFEMKKDFVISFLAFVAAVLSGIIAKGGLRRKWESNRISRGKVKGLKIDLMLDDSEPSLKKIAGDLKVIIREHDIVITGKNISEQ